MATIKVFEDIDAWQQARLLSKEIFELTNVGTFSKDYGLRDQINKASGSIMDNIAEGFERGGTKEFIQFLGIAKGSTGEVRSQLCRAFDRKHLTNEQYIALIESTTKISKMINAFIVYLRNSKLKGMKFNE
jgi:four helix bundle protein